MNQKIIKLTPEFQWRFFLFGGLKVWHAGELVNPPSPRVQEFLSLLLLKPHRIDRLSLSGILFSDLSEAQSRRRLSDHLWLLRKELPDLPLEVSPETIHFPPATRWLDVETFRDAEKYTEIEAWEGALSLYADELLPGQYVEWLLIERESLHLQWVRLIHKVIDVLIEARNYQRALPHLEKLVQVEPLDEGALRSLMNVYAALSQRGAALAAYERYQQYLMAELKVEPDPVTQALANSLYDPHYQRSQQPAINMDCGDTPEAVLRQARDALYRVDHQVFVECLPWLKENCGSHLDLQVKLLEIDYALVFADLSKAREIISSLDASSALVQLRLAKVALDEGDLEAARSSISQVLLNSQETGDSKLELEGLIVLAKIQRGRGQMVQAAISVKKALRLGWQLEAREQIVRALIEDSGIRILQGRYGEALSLLEQARPLAYEHGFRGLLANVLNEISKVQTYKGNFTAAKEPAESALKLWRDLGMLSQEVKTLHVLGMLENQLGNKEEALRTIERAEKIAIQLGDKLKVAKSQYNLAWAIIYHDEGEVERAINFARKALATFKELDQIGWTASTLAVLGYNLWIAGENELALSRLKEAYAIHEEIGEVAVLPELLAYQGLVLLEIGRKKEALERTQQALLALSHSPLENDIVSEIYYARAAVLEAEGDTARACEYYNRAYQNLLKYAEQFDEESTRQAFFRRDPTIRRLMEKIYEHGIAPRPDQGIVQPWVQTKGGNTVKAFWTLDAGPPDAALRESKGTVALRRTRLGRILRESKIQSLSPTVNQLAETLGVSSRTIKRDLAALRETESSF